MKRPAFQFYPGDWLEDIGLRASSLAARGLWADILCFTHQGEPYGHLRKNNRDISPLELARMVGAAPGAVGRLLAELEDHHVFSRTEAGTIYSRRQVRDEALREKRGAYGGLSQGHPDVPRKKVQDTTKDTFLGTIGGSPSSPSPSSTSPPNGNGSSVSLSSDQSKGGGAGGGAVLALRPEEREEYARAVWDALLEKRGRGGPEMSSAEWHVVCGWMDAEVPLRIVLRGILDCAGKVTPRTTLLYLKPSVQDAIDHWRRSQML